MASPLRRSAASSVGIPDDQPPTKRLVKRTGELEARIPIWTGPEYSRIAPGQYTATAVRVIEAQFLRRWQRYSLGVCFRPFAEPEAEVVLFLNLDADMKPKRGGEYYRAWTLANGQGPMKREPMDPAIFLEGQIYEIEVVDAGMDADGKQKSDAEIYSKVKRIVSVMRDGSSQKCVVPFSRK
jgi:hypothetical protein